jgi:tRNA (guanine37-N1)-methyltransferase
LALVCGHYEGVDERVVPLLGAAEVSIGDYVLTGGELPAMVVVDAVCRLVPGVIDAASVPRSPTPAASSSTPTTPDRPSSEPGGAPILLSGHHASIARWRREEAIRRTARRRPDLLLLADLTAAEREIAAEVADDDDESLGPWKVGPPP